MSTVTISRLLYGMRPEEQRALSSDIEFDPQDLAAILWATVVPGPVRTILEFYDGRTETSNDTPEEIVKRIEATGHVWDPVFEMVGYRR